MAHLLAAISGHGFGHLAQSAPVLNRLLAGQPGLRLSVRSALPREVLARRIDGPFHHQAVADDFGMVMRDALAVDVAASAARYRELHRHWNARVDQVACELERSAPDLVFGDVPYLTLAAAARVGIPAVAMCCLNWADIYHYYCSALPEAGEIHGQMLAAYNGARLFLRTEPAMPMPGLDNLHSIGPVAYRGVDRRAALNERFGLAADDRLILIGMGGIAFRLPLEQWPALPGLRFVVQRDWGVQRPDVIVLEETGLIFSDVLASCDAVLTKPGYGTFAEAAVAGVPVLYVPREDWPEEPYLVEWLQQQVPCAAIAHCELIAGRIEAPLQALWAAGRRAPPLPDGIAAAVGVLRGLLA